LSRVAKACERRGGGDPRIITDAHYFSSKIYESITKFEECPSESNSTKKRVVAFSEAFDENVYYF